MRVTPQHWEVFLNMCEKHPNLITGKFNGAQGKAEGNILWANVATKLNWLGLGEKAIVEWRRAVTDWKSKVKAKASSLKQAATQTGGGPVNTPPLTPLEERLLNIMGKKGFERDQVRELGIPVAKAVNALPSTEILQTVQTYENVLQEVEVISEPFNMQKIPPTHHFATNICLENKRKHNEIMSSTSQEHGTENTEHDYCEEIKTPKKGKRLKRTNIPRISKNIEDMTSESVIILKNIDKNMSRIADTFEKVADALIMMQQN